jgi:hypothetical protein
MPGTYKGWDGLGLPIRRTAMTMAVALLLGAGLNAQHASVPLAERTRGAERVIVGRVTAVNPVWRTNEHGDRLIVSIARVSVDEALKGPVQGSVDVEIEGGTIGELTLRVSDLEPVANGDRAVFYLTRNARGAYVPHLRGQGFLKLDRSDRVRGENIGLADVRRATAQGR